MQDCVKFRRKNRVNFNKFFNQNNENEERQQYVRLKGRKITIKTELI